MILRRHFYFHFPSEQSLMSMKKKFETEISEWKVKLTEAQNVIAQLKIEISNLEQENKNLNLKYDKFDGKEIILIGHKRLVPFRKAKSLNTYCFNLLTFSFYLLILHFIKHSTKTAEN